MVIQERVSDLKFGVIYTRINFSFIVKETLKDEDYNNIVTKIQKELDELELNKKNNNGTTQRN